MVTLASSVCVLRIRTPPTTITTAPTGGVSQSRSFLVARHHVGQTGGTTLCKLPTPYTPHDTPQRRTHLHRHQQARQQMRQHPNDRRESLQDARRKSTTSVSEIGSCHNGRTSRSCAGRNGTHHHTTGRCRLGKVFSHQRHSGQDRFQTGDTDRDGPFGGTGRALAVADRQ